MKKTIALTLLVAAASCMASEPSTNWQAAGVFQNRVAAADRIVIRDGGALCCMRRDQCEVFVVITNKASLDALIAHVVFEPSEEAPICECCGFPGIDWYKGTNLVSVTAVHHGKWFHWVGAGGNERAILKAGSGTWITNWLGGLGVPKEQLK